MRKSELIAILLPSKKRVTDLLITAFFTSLNCPSGYKAKFFICANYSKLKLFFLKIVLFKKALFIDERKLPWKGMIGAYNYAFELAKSKKAKYVILWADDLIPEKHNWLHEVIKIIQKKNMTFGIFSSDEGHHAGFYGWNIFGGYPCAHFFVAETDLMPGYLVNPKLNAYVADNEIAVDRVKKGFQVYLLPIRVFHQHTLNPTRTSNIGNYEKDLKIMYELHADLTGKLDNVVLRGNVSDGNSCFVPDQNKEIIYSKEVDCLKIDEFKKVAYRPQYSYRSKIWNIRKILNKN
jgi:hypothetical protein